MNDAIICMGEVLWDSLPEGLFLGGAPLNVACHLHRLGRHAVPVSRVGDDVLGREAVRRVRERGLPTDLIQTDAALPTGFVKVDLDTAGIPTYEIVQPVAWDAIERSPALTEAVAGARAVVFGTLAQRSEVSRRAVQGAAATEALTIFDVNLRPPYVDRAVVQASLALADVIKLNDDELMQMRRWFDLPEAFREAVEALAERFGARLVCVTRGADGAVLLHDGRWSEHPGYSVAVRDTVGAGDAFLAALLDGVLAGRDDEATLDDACRLGAYVASRFGATPEHAGEALAEIGTLTA